MEISQKACFAEQLPRLGFRAVGRYRSGGKLELFVDGRRTDELRFSSAEWIVLVLLLKAATCVPTHEAFAAYLDARHLAEQMQDISAQLRGSSPFVAVIPVTVHRNICKLRDKLKQATARAALFGNSISEGEWAHLLLEWDRPLGYRLNVLPETAEIRFLS